MDELGERLASGAVIVMDGALGTELVARGVPMHEAAWSAAALLTHPETVREVHEAYVRAGAQIHITNTYSSARHVLERADLGERTAELNARAVALVREAIERSEPGFETWIAGSISTFDARVTERLDRDELRASFTEQAELLARAGCDLIALEMMLSHEAAIPLELSGDIVAAATATGLPVWFGFSCKLSRDGETLYLYDGSDPASTEHGARDDGQRFDEALRAALSAGLSAAGPMHSDMGATGPAIAALAGLWRGPVVAYPNSGHTLHRRWTYDDVTEPAEFAEAAGRWVRAGAQVVGGCCGIGPEHIAALRGRIPERIERQ